MKLKIVEPGWATFTGQLGWTDFENAVSVNEVSRAEAQHLAAIVQIEEINVATGESTGKSPSAAQVILDTHGKQAASATLPTADQSPSVVAVPSKVYTADELGKLADDSGIKGVRVVADPLGVKGTSIAELIGKVLQAQSELLAKAGTAADEPKQPVTVAGNAANEPKPEVAQAQ